jgi:hypothetical protein
MRSAQGNYGNRAVQRQVAVQRMGWQRPTGGPASGYLYGNQNQKGGLDFGFGYGTGGADSGEWWQRAGGDLLSVAGNLGVWGENDNNDTRYGVKIGGGVGKGEYKGDAVSGDFGVGDFSAEASAGSNGATLGAQANIVEGSITGGKFDNKSNTDEQTRFGLSVGGGAAGRLHWADTDKDGHIEFGAGLDLGPFSMDVKTEDPLRSVMGLGPLGPVGRLPVDVGDWLQPEKKSNMTEDVLGAVVGQDKPLATGDAVKMIKDWWSS